MLAVAMPELDPDLFVTANIGMALGMFVIAAFLTGQLGHYIGPRRRLWLIGCNLMQTCLVFATAAIQYRGVPESEAARQLMGIGFLGFAAGSQVVQSRSLNMSEITTAMATAAWVDLVIDPNQLKLKNRPRNRRAAFIAALVLGTLAGAFVFKRVGSPTAIVLSGAGKLVVTVMYFFNPTEKPKKLDEEKGEKSGSESV